MRNLKKITKVTFLLLIILVSVNSYAQINSLKTDPLKIHTIKGKKYYIHIVKKGESLYSIHKKYNIPLKVITNKNPNVADGLSIGEKIFIPVKKSVDSAIKIDGNFINHTVKKKQTLYAISKLYGVTQKAITAANPKINKGLKDGQEIRIPVVGIKKEKGPNIRYKKYKTHIIQQGETLYSLSKLYNTTVDAIKLINGGLEQGLKTNEMIYITILEDNFSATNLNTQIVDSLFLGAEITRKEEYIIALFLPFYLNTNDKIGGSRNTLDKKGIYQRSKFAIEFYNGVKMALNSMNTSSCKFKLYVYDTNGDDSLRIKSLLLKPVIKKADLIIGPLYFNNFKQVAKFAQKNKIPIVSPVKQKNILLLGNQYVLKAIPSKITAIKNMSKLIVENFKTDNLLAVSYKSKEKILIDTYIKADNNQVLSFKDTTLYSTIKTLNITSNISTIVNNLHLTKNNVIFVPTTNQTFVTNLFSVLTTTLNRQKYKNCTITLIGSEEWMRFENIDLSYFQKLNVHYCSARFIDEENPLVKKFVKEFIKQESTYPSKNTFLGFDLAYCFGKYFINNGTVFSLKLLEEFKGLSINLNFLKTGVENGFENTSSTVLKVDSFMLKRAQ